MKQASDTELSYGMGGMLYLSDSGWLLLQVPNALVRGAFAALQEPGVELPPSGPEGRLNAHISVIRPEELETIGGPEVVVERGKTFRYSLGEIRTVRPAGWEEMDRVWFIKVRSPDLEKLRKSYGLSARPKNNEFDFHITIAVRKKKVLVTSDVTVSRARPELMNKNDIGEIIRNAIADGKSRTIKVAANPLSDAFPKMKHTLANNMFGRNSYLGLGLKRWKPTWMPDSSLSKNILANLNNIQHEAQDQLTKDINGQQLLAGLDPYYAARSTIDYLRNGRQPLAAPTDELAYQFGLLQDGFR